MPGKSLKQARDKTSQTRSGHHAEHGMAEAYGARVHGGRDEKGRHAMESFKSEGGERTYRIK